MEAKSALRLAIKERLSHLTHNDRRVESAIIVRWLKQAMNAVPSGAIALYAPYADEPDVVPLTESLLAAGRVVTLPLMTPRGIEMRRVESAHRVVRNPVTNIPEPVQGQTIDEDSIALAIVPGRAFTLEGVRLGRGNGGYDTWIQQQRKRNPATRFVGICFDCQLLTHIPTEPHDERMDTVVAPRVCSRPCPPTQPSRTRTPKSSPPSRAK